MLVRTKTRCFMRMAALLSCFGVSLFGQTQVASLRPHQELRWHRISPSAEHPDGPVLYQLLFNANGIPGTVPAFDTNPRHLTNSPITVNSGNVFVGGASGLGINGTTGIITFANGQTFPGTAGVNSVAAGNNFITIGGSAANPTIGLNAANTDLRYLTLPGGTMTGLISFANGQTFPGTGNGTVTTVSGTAPVTVTNAATTPNISIAAGGIGNGLLANPSVSINTSAGLAGGGTLALGGTLSLNTNATPNNTASAIVSRDGSGNFAAGTVTLSGNLALPNTASDSVGVISLGGLPFIHNFGSGNTFLGQNAGNLAMTGSSNSAMGNGALDSDTTGGSNTASGWGALANNSTASDNTATGFTALINNTTGASNTATGSGALSFNTTGNQNTANGFNALQFNTTGNQNTATGSNALSSNTNGFNNTAVGNSALLSNTSGGGNTASGWFALSNNTTGLDNTAIGRAALSNNQTGSDNTAIGRNALASNTTGILNTAIGDGADISAGNLNNATAIGASARVDASNKIRLGSTTVTVIEGQVAYSFTSDKNKKENFRPVDGEQVLNKIGGLNLTSWNYICHDPRQFRHYGPVAQEFFAAFGHDGLGTVGTPTTINSGDMEGILMIAVQALEKHSKEQSKQLRSLRAENTALRAQIRALLPRLAAVERSASQASQLARR